MIFFLLGDDDDWQLRVYAVDEHDDDIHDDDDRTKAMMLIMTNHDNDDSDCDDDGDDDETESLSKRRFWATVGNRKWTFGIPGQWFLPDFQTNRLYQWKDT